MAVVSDRLTHITETSKSRLKGLNIHVARADDSNIVIHGEVLGVQHDRGRVEIDLDSCSQQRFVVGALRVLDHELITLLTNEEFDIDATLCSSRDRVQQ